MTAQKNNPSEQKIDDKIVARIDGQDESFILPIRQFLETRGCSVIIGSGDTDEVTYHIAAGDIFFVKSIFSSEPPHKIKRLALILEDAGDPDEIGIHAVHAKIVFLSPKLLDAREIEKIFAFFFTDEKQVLNLLPQNGPVKKTKPRDQDIQEDADRIKKTMAEIFNEKPPTRVNNRTISRLPLFLLFMLLLVSPFLWYLVSVAMTITTLGLGSKLITDGNMKQGAGIVAASGFWNRQGQGSLRIIGFPFVFAGYPQIIRRQEQMWSLFSDVQKGVEGTIQAIEHGRTAARDLLATSEVQANQGTLAITIDSIRSDIFLMRTHLGLAQAQTNRLVASTSFPFSIPWVAKTGREMQKKLANLRIQIETMDNLLSLYQKIGGFNEKKTYLLLFQNSMELRPGGGFIGSVGLVTMEEGKLVDLQIQDVYAIDGQLKGHVDPPKPISELLHQEHWYLRDSNWDPDFSLNGQKARWFYEKETGIKVDGVFAINVPIVSRLLVATGPITLSDYNDRITADNFFAKSLYYTQNNFFPGSTQKKDFLGSLIRAIMEKLTTQKTDALLTVRAIVMGLKERDLMFFFDDPKLEAFVSQLGWGGVAPQKQLCDGPGCFFDYLFLTEANVGVNKSNYFLKREILRQVAVGEDGTIHETMTIAYKNSSPGDSGGGGSYTTYARLYTPLDSIFSSVTLDGQHVPARKEQKNTIALLPYTTSEPSRWGISPIGIAFDVPAGQERRLVISYERSSRLVFVNGEASLNLYMQKQPGFVNTKVQTVVSYPIFWRGQPDEKLFEEAPKHSFLVKEAQLTYNTDLSGDSDIFITFFK